MGKRTIKWESRHCVSKDWDIARSRRKPQRTGSWTEHLLTRRSWLKTGLPPTAVTSSEQRNGHRTHQISISGELWLNATRHFNPSLIQSISWRKSCEQYGMICHRTLSTRPSWALSKDFELVSKLGADTLNTSSNKLFSQSFELWKSEMSNFHVFVWFQYKHYDENWNFHSNYFLHGSVVI